MGSPLFARSVLHLAAGKTLVVEASGNNREAVFVRRVSFDGKVVEGHTLDHAALIKGGTLRFEMMQQAT